LEFLAKFFRAIFFSWAESAKLKGYTENQTELARKPRQADRPKGPRQRFAPDFSLGRAFSPSFFGQKILREV
jgi:hypothetical protein